MPIKFDLRPEASGVIDLRPLPNPENETRVLADWTGPEWPAKTKLAKIDLSPEASRVIDLRSLSIIVDETPRGPEMAFAMSGRREAAQ